ncbi:MAG: hypothetical protein SGBAC_004650 [Bacillariaceae sp.]
MAVSESNTACGPTASDVTKEDYATSTGNGKLLKSTNSLRSLSEIRSHSEIDKLLEASERFADESGHSETEAYDGDTLEPAVPSADFVVDLSKLSPEEVTSLLNHTKENGAKRRAENAKMITLMEQKLSNLEGKLKRKLGMTSVATYTQAIKPDMPLPTYVITNQTQLCRAFHVHEVYLNQTKKMQKRNKKLLSFLTKQIKSIHAESERREIPLQKQVAESKREVVRMCRILEINPDDWKKPEENELLKRVSEVLTGIPMLGEWARSFSEGSSRDLSQGSK